MSTSTQKSWLLQGIRDGLPFVLIVVPFAMLFGVVATEAGLNLAETMAMTILVIAGAAQFTALALLEDNAPTLIVIITALAVNLRMALYSASMAVHLGKAPIWQKALVAYFLVDQSYNAAALKYDAEPDASVRQKIVYFFGVMIPIAPLWYLFTWIGAVAGNTIPEAFALDFALPITFIAMVAPSLRSLPHIIAATLSVVVSLALAWMPYSIGLLAAAGIAMFAGAYTEIALEKRRAKA